MLAQPVAGALCDRTRSRFGPRAPRIVGGTIVRVLFGAAEPEGNLPLDIPSSMAAVEASRPGVPYRTEAPSFRSGPACATETPGRVWIPGARRTRNPHARVARLHSAGTPSGINLRAVRHS
jgi:hypothetical protein